jgi:cell division protein FtsB
MEDVERDSEVHSVVETPNTSVSGDDKLTRKIRDLKAERDRLNQEIATLERARALLETTQYE